MRAIIKGLIVWLLASVPVGILLGTIVSTLVPEDAAVDRFTAAGNGAIAGAELAVLGAIAAVATTATARGKLKRAGGSECLTGAVVSYGLIVIGLALLLAAKS